MSVDTLSPRNAIVTQTIFILLVAACVFQKLSRLTGVVNGLVFRPAAVPKPANAKSLKIFSTTTLKPFGEENEYMSHVIINDKIMGEQDVKDVLDENESLKNALARLIVLHYEPCGVRDDVLSRMHRLDEAITHAEKLLKGESQ